jgi:uncharacterized protein (TIGR02757 family)
MRIDARQLKPALDRLYTAFDHPESAFDPIQVVRRYAAVEDREIVGFLAAGLAFGRVASVVASVEAVCRALGPRPAAFIRTFDPATDGGALRPLVHRWIRGADLVAVFVILRDLLRAQGSLEAAFASGLAESDVDVGAALERFANMARAIDLREAYGRKNAKPGAHYFLARPSTGSACKRLNLYLRWMARKDGVDPGGWTRVHPRQLIVPLDTHTIRVGRCLGLTHRASPGWKMAVDITTALRAIDPDDPVRYDFSLCHLGMMNACGFNRPQADAQCPLRGACRPRVRKRQRSRPPSARR